MAGSAELLKSQTGTYDWDIAEAQFTQSQLIDITPDTVSYERPPEAEIYGRSLSTVHRFGDFIIEKATQAVTRSPEADQARAEFYTSVEEGFGTDMELGGGLEVRDFSRRTVIGGRVMAKDLKTPISDMTYAGLRCAEKKVRSDERFWPQLVRSRHDDNNALITDDMAQGKTDYNTRIVPTLYPKEAAAKSGHNYWRNIGYVPHLERGFLQLYYNGEDGFVSGSLSFDGSNIHRLREVLAKRGIYIPEDEVTDNCLQYAITGTMSEEQAKELTLDLADQLTDPKYKKTTNTVEVTNEHRAIMDTVFDDSYVHACESSVRGYQTPGVRRLISQLADKAENFNEHYAEALYQMKANKDQFTDDDMVVLHELLVYSTIEIMRALHLGKTEAGTRSLGVHRGIELDVAHFQNLSVESFQSILSSFGAEGAKNNRVYSACGLEIAPGESTHLSENPQAVFGGLDSLSPEELSWHGGTTKKGVCVNCYKYTEVGVKSWCQNCINC